jgi:hypothetical protein
MSQRHSKWLTAVLGLLVLGLAGGWWQREQTFAQEREKLVQSKTISWRKWG